MIGPTSLCPQGIELILLDLDDTVLIDGTTMSARVIDTITLARERGCMACVASGRDMHMIPRSLRGPEAMDYLICANGSRIYDTIEGLMCDRTMSREQVLALMDALEPLGAGWNAFIGTTTYFEWRSLSYLVTGRRKPLTASQTSAERRASLHTGGTYKLLRRGMRFGKRMLFNREGMEQVWRVRPYVEAAEDGIAKLGCSFPSYQACERALDVIGHMGCFEAARMSTTELEITGAGVSKATAAVWLMERLNVDPQRAVAFGDSENDAPLAGVCGTFVAVENGDDRIKEIADDVCESVYDDGVARWLERAMAEADGARHGTDD